MRHRTGRSLSMSVGDLWQVISNKQLVEFYNKHNELIWRGAMDDINTDILSKKVQWLIVEPTGCLDIFI